MILPDDIGQPVRAQPIGKRRGLEHGGVGRGRIEGCEEVGHAAKIGRFEKIARRLLRKIIKDIS